MHGVIRGPRTDKVVFRRQQHGCTSLRGHGCREPGSGGFRFGPVSGRRVWRVLDSRGLRPDVVRRVWNANGCRRVQYLWNLRYGGGHIGTPPRAVRPAVRRTRVLRIVVDLCRIGTDDDGPDADDDAGDRPVHDGDWHRRRPDERHDNDFRQRRPGERDNDCSDDGPDADASSYAGGVQRDVVRQLQLLPDDHLGPSRAVRPAAVTNGTIPPTPGRPKGRPGIVFRNSCGYPLPIRRKRPPQAMFFL